MSTTTRSTNSIPLHHSLRFRLSVAALWCSMILSAFATRDVVFRIPSGSGLGNNIVVATNGTSSTDNSIITTSHTPYFAIQYSNQGSTSIPSGSFTNRLILDGNFLKNTTNSSTVSANNANSVLELGWIFGSSPPLKAGSHIAEVILDVNNNVNETGVPGGESNNRNIRHFLVTAVSGSDMAPLHFGNPSINSGTLWSDRLVLSTVTGTNTDAPTIKSTDTIHVDWLAMNFGPTPTATTFSSRLLLDGNVVAGSLIGAPAGLNQFQAVQGIDIAIPPLSPGQHTLELQVDYLNQLVESDNSNNSYSRTFTVVPVKPVITSSLAASANQTQAFNYQITANNFPSSFNATGLPAGLMINTSTGAISGSPTVSGNFNVSLSAINGAGTGTATLSLNVIPSPPVITSTLTAVSTQGLPFNYQITATNSPTSFSATGLPSGLMFNTSTGAISGTPSVNGNFNIGLSATNAGGTGMATLALSLAMPPPVITSNLVASGSQDSPFSYQITATNSPTGFDATGLPAGLMINTSTGAISGMPTVGGNFDIGLSATNSGGTGTATLVLSLAVSPPVINSSLTAGAAQGSPFDYQITATNSPTSFNATGLPAGLMINTSTGAISGTPAVAGEFNIGLSATNGTGTGNATLALVISGTVVTTLEDSGPGSLRQLITDLPSGETITFDPTLDGQVITLGGTPILIEKDLTIDASSLRDGITISGDNATNSFEIESGNTVVMDSLTISDGSSTFGGGIHNRGNLTLTSSTIAGNSVSRDGGGVYCTGTSVLTATNSVFSGNAAGFGAGIINFGIMTLSNCTISGNSALDQGGGIYNRNTLTVTNSTFSGNSASSRGGGAIYMLEGTVSLINATLSGNSAGARGGGLLNEPGIPATLNLTNTIVADNTATNSPDIAGPVSSSTGVNLIGNDTGVTGLSASDLRNQPALLNTLGNFGGPTQTMPPLPGSPALDATPTGEAKDQRGITRPLTASYDLGAVEGAVSAATFELVYDGDLDGSATGFITLNTALFPNPGNYSNSPTSAAGVFDFRLTVSGATSGNGSFDLRDVTAWIWTTTGSVDFTRNLVGQIEDFNVGVSGGSPSAPVGVGPNVFATDGGTGEAMTLVSMIPVSSFTGMITNVAFGADTVTLTYAGLNPAKTYHVAAINSANGVDVTLDPIADTEFTPISNTGSIMLSSDRSLFPTRMFTIVEGALP